MAVKSEMPPIKAENWAFKKINNQLSFLGGVLSGV
jgi:hypothetical protein